MRLAPFIFVLLLGVVGCHQRPFLMKGAMNVNGNMGMDGNMNMTGDMDMTGDMSMKGDMNITGDMTMKGDMAASIKTDNTASRLSVVTVSGHPDAGPKIAVVDVDGLLIDKNISGLGSMGENPVALFREKLNVIDNDASIGAIVLRINSPGGGVTASDIMSHDLSQLKTKRGIPVVACLMVTGTGGAYYLATHADAIIAHPTSVVGGIGVILNAYNLEDTMAQFNILSEPIKAGEKIDLGTPERVMEDEERELLQEMADSFHDRFIDQVKFARPDAQDKGLFDGRVFTGVQAEQNDLIDRVGYLEDAIEQARKMCGAGSQGPVVMLRRNNDRAYTALDVTPNNPLATSLLPFKLPGLDRSSMPTFLYLWQADSSLAAVTQ